ncbi:MULTISPECIES: FeoC-like transcriptional regulator [Aliivibrio]|uniref:Ferrous iron transport protein C n=2 Tax=Aliivibrio logei TaxID=688 RepID=A0A1B9P1S8_ALILO|nr:MULTISPECIES: FeoC-like transcriptional regulator [Aliivibrio]MBB1314295.1 FeoC-like transcriptional regulator [Aliivibrio sp. SR45-2]OCH22312.1 ferrous iron transport protein C [Aliivibrio logei]OEF13522.1 ferrous iron transport protein C [Aliivibrio logei 5S-186]
MILTELKQYIDEEGRVERLTLAKKFSMSEDGVDAMLELWVKKGKLTRELIGCDKTQCCQDAERVWYRPVYKDELMTTYIR